MGFSSGRGPRIVALRGMGGQGKTQIALEYCRRVKGKRGVFWVDATSETTVKRSFDTIATKIQATEDIMDVLGDSLDPWLMVFDNYDDADHFDNIRDYMPDGEDGCILITSRHAASINLVVDLDYAIELGGLLEHEALELLWKHSRVKEAAPAPNGSTVIVEKLGHHPLAITQAGLYIRRQKISLDQFLEHYSTSREKILKHTPLLTEYRKSLGADEKETSLSVFTTWELSFEQLLRTSNYSAARADLLTLFAFFDCQNISEELFIAYTQEEFDRAYCL
jgi:hypothetical protein